MDEEGAGLNEEGILSEFGCDGEAAKISSELMEGE